MNRAGKKTAIVLGIAGGTGSGKTTLAEAVCRALGGCQGVIIDQDSYYVGLKSISPDARHRVNYDHPSAFDWELFRRQVRSLSEGRTIRKPVYDFVNHARLPRRRIVQPHPVVIVEGLLVLGDRVLRRLMDIRIYVEAAADLRFIRRLERDVRERGRSMESVIEQYLCTVRPMHLEFVAPSKLHSEIVVAEGGRNRQALDHILSRIEGLRSERNPKAHNDLR